MALLAFCAAISILRGAYLIVSAFRTDGDGARSRVPQAQLVRDGARVARDRRTLEVAARVMLGVFLTIVGVAAIVIVNGAR